MERMYEAVIFIKPTLSEEELAGVTGKCKSFITENNGTVSEEKAPEKRRLAFDVKKFRDAYYYFIKFILDTSLIGEYNKKLRIIEEVLRESVVLYQEPKIRPKKAKKVPAEAPKPAAAPQVAAVPEPQPSTSTTDIKDSGI